MLWTKPFAGQHVSRINLNEGAIEALARGTGVTGERGRLRDLSYIAGTWRKDPAFDRAVAAQHTIDEE
jgi:hypothetical protein